MLYEIHLQPTAQKELDKLKRKARVRWQAVIDRLQELGQDPDLDTLELQDPVFERLRRAKTDQDRIFFQKCEDCRSDLTLMNLRNCVDCKDIPENGIKVFEIHPVSIAYDKKRRK